MPSFALAMLVAIAVPFVLTVAVGKQKGIDKQAQAAQAEADEEAAKEAKLAEISKNVESEREIKAYLNGKVIPLKEIGDGVFSEGMLGDGLAIKPKNELVCAPVSGKITMLIEDSKHAVSMTLSNGAELLIHVGIDTVGMKGDGFEYLVKMGDIVKAGTPLITFNRDKIKAAGHPDTAIMLITNPNGVNFKFNSGMQAKSDKTIIATC